MRITMDRRRYKEIKIIIIFLFSFNLNLFKHLIIIIKQTILQILVHSNLYLHTRHTHTLTLIHSICHLTMEKKKLKSVTNEMN